MNDTTDQTKDQSAEKNQLVDPALLEILVCPVTKQPLSYDRSTNELVSQAAQLAFPVRDGIPIMLIEEARDLKSERQIND